MININTIIVWSGIPSKNIGQAIVCGNSATNIEPRSDQMQSDEKTNVQVRLHHFLLQNIEIISAMLVAKTNTFHVPDLFIKLLYTKIIVAKV